MEPDRRSWKYVRSKGFFQGLQKGKPVLGGSVDGGWGGGGGLCISKWVELEIKTI